MSLKSHNGITVVQSTAEELSFNTSKQLTSDTAMTLEVTDKVKFNMAASNLEIPQRTGTQLDTDGGSGETFQVGDIVFCTTSVGEYVADTAYICTVAGTGNDNFTLVKLGSGGIATVADVTAAKAVTPSFDNDLLYIVSMESIYRYEATELSSETSDDIYLITPTADSNARWKAVCGKYVYESLTQNSQVVKSTSITSATTGTFVTGHGGSTPVISAKFWDDSASLFNEISPASLSLDINAAGTEIDYDTTGLTFDTNDYLELKAIYQGLATTPSNEYDSGWILVSAINDTLKGASVSGYHEVNLPSGFTDNPAGITVLRNDGSNEFPVDIASTVVLSNNGSGTYRIAVETTGWSGTDQFRIIASKSARPTGQDLTIVADTINEVTADNGVNVDGVILKDGLATFTGSLLTNLTNAQATELGLKEYNSSIALHSGSYTPSVDSTILRLIFFNASSGYISAVPYKSINGVWRLRFNIEATVSAAATNLGCSIDGVKFAGRIQAVYSRYSSNSYSNVNTGEVTSFGDSGTKTSFYWSGDVELAQKPAWAD